MEKENGEREKNAAAGDPSALMDPLSLFSGGHGIFGSGLPSSYGHHLNNAAYSALLAGGRGGQYSTSPHPSSTNPYGSLGTLSVAASQAASLGINPASAAWWTMAASHMAAQEYLARLQAAGMPFTGLPSDLPGFPLLSPQHPQVSGTGKSGSHTKSSLSHGHSASTSSHHPPPLVKDQHSGTKQSHSPASHSKSSHARVPTSHPSTLPSILNDPSGVLGGVRLPPDTEIIKYTSSIVGPKVPGTTNRGRKKTISLDPPSVSVTPTGPNNKGESGLHQQLSPHLSAGLSVDQEPREPRDLADILKLQQNGQITPQASPVPPGYHTPPDDAPLNLSLKPASVSPASANNALQSLSSLSQSLGSMPDRISRRKPGPKPRKVTQSPLPPPGPAPSASLAQLFAAADAPRPTDETNSSTHHKDGRPRNLGRGVSKPKKNTVASLLAQSRAMGLKPPLDLNSPLNHHHVNLLKANLAASTTTSEGDSEADDKNRNSPLGWTQEDAERTRLMVQQLAETYSEPSSYESDSESEQEHGLKREGDPLSGEDGPSRPKRHKMANEENLRIPLQNGWKRETVINRFGLSGIHGRVTYISPPLENFGMTLVHTNIRDVKKHLEKYNITNLTKDNFTFSARVILGEYHAKEKDKNVYTEHETRELVEQVQLMEAMKIIDSNKVDKDKQALAAKEARKAAKEEATRNKEYSKMIKEQEKTEKQEALRKEREQRSMQIQEARRKRQEEAGKLRQEQQQRKLEEKELKKQQTAFLKQEIYMQEVSKQREMFFGYEVERERRRQHMSLVKQLEVRKRQEDREKRRKEVRAEKMASREKRMEQRKIEMDLLTEIRKPVEDMELPDLKSLPQLNRIPGLRLSGQAFSDALMVFEFLHNYGETLGFDMGSLPTLNSLQNALLGDEEAEEELLSVMTHLIICAIEDPGIPNPARHTTLLGQSLKQADITHANLSEILRIYLYANATGEVKSLTGVQFEREKEKRLSDHHNNMTETATEDTEGKNAAFFVALRDNPTWKMSEWLKHKPFLALNATAKAKILQFLCHELLQNKAVIRQIDNAIETVAQHKRDRWTNDSKLRKLRHLHNRKVRQMMLGGKLPLEGDDDPPPPPHDEEEGEGESGNESEGTQPEEEEDKKLSIEEMTRKLEKLNRQAEQTLASLSESGGQLRAVCYGQDRYWRRYWCLPTAGGLFVEAMESAEPELFDELLNQDDADFETPDIKSEHDAEVLKEKPLNDDFDDEMPLLTPEVDTETLLSKLKEQDNNDNIDEEPAELLKQEKEDSEKNGRLEEMETEESQSKNDGSGGEEDSETKSLADEKKSQTFQLSGEDSLMNGQEEPAWFSVLPREPCDSTSVTATTSAFRCGIENSELRIPVFPPPPASPSPSQCDSPSPAPLALTPEESAQLQHCKIHGLPRPAPAKPIPYELRCGWWRITDTSQLQHLVENLHSRGAREKELRRSIMRPCLDQSWSNTLKLCVRPGSSATQLVIGQEEVGHGGGAAKVPPRDGQDDWNYGVALRVDMAVLEQVEAMEDKVANASMQVKGWKVPPRASSEEGRQFQPSCSHPLPTLNPIIVAKGRLLHLESIIERRYLKPPLGVIVSAVDVNLSVSSEPETLPKGLVIWREAVSKSQTAAQISMALHMLEASIAWDKSIMKANCQFCHSGDNEDKLLLCDGCDKGYHTYCFKPKMENIPEGDWFCYECLNKATGDKACIVCGKKIGRNLVVCDNCPKAYHTDCLQPPLTKVPRGKWHCPACFAMLPRKRLNAKRTVSSSSPSSSQSRSQDEPSSSASATEPATSCGGGGVAVVAGATVEEVPPEEAPHPQPPVKKEKPVKRLMRDVLQLLDELERHDDAWPFLVPVNTKQFPTYKKIIKNPMDFGTIRKRLMDSGYKSREEFCSDVRLIFNNCETFNEDDSPVGKAGHSMRMFFETRWTELTNQKPPSS